MTKPSSYDDENSHLDSAMKKFLSASEHELMEAALSCPNEEQEIDLIVDRLGELRSIFNAGKYFSESASEDQANLSSTTQIDEALARIIQKIEEIEKSIGGIEASLISQADATQATARIINSSNIPGPAQFSRPAVEAQQVLDPRAPHMPHGRNDLFSWQSSNKKLDQYLAASCAWPGVWEDTDENILGDVRGEEKRIAKCG